MTEITQYDNPNDISYMDTLKIETVSKNISPKIYANGKNQLPIEITVKASNKDRKVLKFSKDMWINLLNLCFAESDKKLSRKGSTGWCFTDKENDYSKEIHGGSLRNNRFSEDDDGAIIIILYVYTNDMNTKRIAVSVDPGNGKHFTTADASSGTEKMFVRISSLAEIHYSDKRNITIDIGGLSQITSNLCWTARLHNSSTTFYPHCNGTCERRFVNLRPNMSTTGQTSFKNHQITYDPIRNNDINTGRVSWVSHIEDGFNILKKGVGYPCAVIGRGVNYPNYQLNIWFSRRNNIFIDGQIFTHRDRDDYNFRFCPFVKEDHEGDYEEGFASLILYKFTMHESDAVQREWKDCVKSPTVKVTDFYGNEGTFQLAFNDSDNFDIPGIV